MSKNGRLNMCLPPSVVRSEIASHNICLITGQPCKLLGDMPLAKRLWDETYYREKVLPPEILAVWVHRSQ